MRPASIWGELSGAAAVLLNVIDGGKRLHRTGSPARVEAGSVLRAVPEPALLLDRRAHIVDLNEAAERLITRSRAELLGTSAEWLVKELTGEPQAETQSLLSRTLDGEGVQSSRKLFRTPAGEALPVTVALRPVCDTSGAIAGALISIQDVSELSHLEHEIEHSERHLAVREMTAGLVHDFSNVLTTVSEAVMVLDAGGKQSEHDRAVLGIISNAVRRGGETISNMRKFLAGKCAERCRVDVRQLLEEVLEITDPILNTHTGIHVVRDTHACGAVSANQDELRRAFTNLVLNALEAMTEQGTLTVGCRQVSDRVVVAVSDTGSGIPPEVQKKIFSAYFTTKSKGTGLGLVGARRAIEAQGGNIRFESAPGRGTTFYVSLPTSATPAQRGHDAELAERRVS